MLLIRKRHIKGEKHIVPVDFAEHLIKPLLRE